MGFRPGSILFFIIFFLLMPSGIILANTEASENQNPLLEELFEGFVYYSDADKIALKSVKKNFSSSLDAYSLGMEIVRMVIKGPSDAVLRPTWPENTKLNAFFITDDGSAFIDLDIDPSLAETMDTTSELLAIYSMVNSLALNISKIKQVKILIQGKDAQTLAGHIGLEHFYKANMLIVK